MSKTAMQELIEFIDDKFIVSNSPQISSIYHKAQELLEKEKEQIMDSYLQGSFDDGPNITNSEQYYNQTYKNEG